MHICFDNDKRLRQKQYLFEYCGVRFKLVQENPRKWADHLLTVIPRYDITHRESAFSVASQFLAALSWENRARVAVWEAGGWSLSGDIPLSKARPRTFTRPNVPFGGDVTPYELSRIPKVETDSERIALTLFREARASNNIYLSFLFFWQILEIMGDKPEKLIERAYRRDRQRLMLHSDDLAALPLQGRSLSNYLRDDCRDAIAHINRKPGKRKLELDKVEERTRITVSTRVIRAFAEYQIVHGIGLKASLYLVRASPRSVPIFSEERFIDAHGYRLAYQ